MNRISAFSKSKPFHFPPLRAWRDALRPALVVYSLIIAAALIGSFAPYESVLREGHPWLPENVCGGCALCGLTRSFCAMSAARWQDAGDWNPLGPAFYVFCWLWIFAAAFFAMRAAPRFIRNARRIRCFPFARGRRAAKQRAHAAQCDNR